jgi:uncharacterized membrane protein
MLRLTVVFAMMLFISSVVWADGASFRGIGPIYVSAISADGNVVVGIMGGHAYYWTEVNELTDLGESTDPTFVDVSADGSVIVGTDSRGAFRWTEATGKLALVELEVGYGTHARSVSTDGSVVAGEASDSSGGPYPVRWSEPNQITKLFDNSGIAMDISANGMVIVGRAELPPDLILQAYRWTEATGAVGLQDPPEFYSNAYSVSSDGSVIVGHGPVTDWKPFRWTQETGMVYIGELDESGSAWDVSADGNVVVGYCNEVAFIWDINLGMADLKEILELSYGLDLTDWSLSSAVGISADGLTIVGNGTDPNGNPQGWIARLAGDSLTVNLTINIEPNDVGINTVTPGVGQHIYYPGQTIYLNADNYMNCPDVYSLSHWVGNVSDPNSSETSIILMEDESVTAVYSLNEPQCGDECHPILQGDLNGDCYVNFDDFAIYCTQWLACTHPDCD